MSRSRKKVPIIKDSSNSANKKTASRRARRVAKVAVKKDKEIIPVNKEVTNQYNVCDHFIMASNKEDAKKYRRK
jgi:hypothetical protein